MAEKISEEKAKEPDEWCSPSGLEAVVGMLLANGRITKDEHKGLLTGISAKACLSELVFKLRFLLPDYPVGPKRAVQRADILAALEDSGVSSDGSFVVGHAPRSENREGCQCVCHQYPEHGKLQDALEALRWHQERLKASGEPPLINAVDPVDGTGTEGPRATEDSSSVAPPPSADTEPTT